jgi:translation initiation factor IF-3
MHRINNQISSTNIRLIGEDSKQIGIISIKDAIRMAQEKGLDLVEISGNISPPVCRILDYSKYTY